MREKMKLIFDHNFECFGQPLIQLHPPAHHWHENNLNLQRKHLVTVSLRVQPNKTVSVMVVIMTTEILIIIRGKTTIQLIERLLKC